METLAASKEQEIVRLRTDLKTAQAAIPAEPPKKIVVDDNEPAKKPAVKKKPVAKKPATTPARPRRLRRRKLRRHNPSRSRECGVRLSGVRKISKRVASGSEAGHRICYPSFRIQIAIRESGMSFHGSIPAAIFGIVIICVVLLDAFETVVLPRRVTRHFRLTAWFYRRTWIPWKKIAGRIRTPSRQQSFLGYFGPLSLILLMEFWAASLIFGFALLQYGIGGHEQLGNEPITFGRILYHSGETFFTLGYGDIVPTSSLARALSVIEAGMGFAFLGVVIGYLPVVYASFSRREIQISMLDARAGSPPTAAELLVRLAGSFGESGDRSNGSR